MKNTKILGIVIIISIIAVYAGAKIYVTKLAKAEVDVAIAETSDTTDITYKKVSVDLLGMDVHISDITVSPINSDEILKINEIIIHDFDKESEVPTFFSFSCNGIEVNIKEAGKEADKLRALGYKDKMLANISAHYAFDKEKKELTLKNIGIGAEEAGNIMISFRLGNINLEQEAVQTLFFTFPSLLLHDAQITYEDDSFIERVMALEAQKSQTTLEEFKKSLFEELDEKIANEKDDYTKKGLMEIKGFFENPKKISLTASPSEPLPLGALMNIEDPKELIKLLNIKIKS
ncbi:MAG: hypothetical protein OEM02_00720 [Desulfobulbaceae bacterium]|nr:hypothetical protein [Desulfobulbaceae bacterium]